MSFRLLLRPAAVVDLRDAWAWYEERQRGLGAEFMDAVEHKLAQVQSNPLQFPAVRGVMRRAIVMHHARAPLRWQRRG